MTCSAGWCGCLLSLEVGRSSVNVCLVVCSVSQFLVAFTLACSLAANISFSKSWVPMFEALVLLATSAFSSASMTLSSCSSVCC